MNSEHFKAVERLVAVAAGNEAHVSAAAEQIGWQIPPPVCSPNGQNGAHPIPCTEKLTWGATHTEMVGSRNFLVPEILTALEGIDAEVVVAVSAADREPVTATSPNARIKVGLPLHTLPPTCDAIVHHGSSETMRTAASAGVPQVIVPISMDRAEIAQLVADSGAGTHVPLAAAETAYLSAAPTRALSDTTMRKSAESLRQEMLAAPSPSEVKTLEELV